MVQRKINFYFSQPPRQEELCGSSSFLYLPYEIRRRIYVLAGLVRFCPINMNQEGPRAEDLRTGVKQVTGYACFYRGRRFFGKDFGIDDVPGCECPALPFSLLCVSRAISEEVSNILYSENAFTISRSDLRGLAPLRNMSERAVSSLRCLTVRLNNCECVFQFTFREPPGMPPCHPLCWSHGLHDKPLSNQTRQGNAIIRDWQDLSSTLAVHLQPGQLRLDFVCDTRDLPTAQQMAGLLSTLPLLRACSIRLGPRPDWGHHILSRTTALRLLGTPSSDDHKAYSYYLPSEILTRILEYSDLVAPYDLEWQPDGGFSPYDCCTTCTATLDCCTCSKFHAAYSTSCTCWTPPTSTFLVNRQVHDVAMAVFYGRNRFVVLPRGARLDNFDRCSPGFPQQAPLAQFLRTIPRRAQKLIRFLGLVIPAFVPGSAAPGGDGQQAWKDTIDLVRQRLDVQQLQLSVYFGSVFFADPAGPERGTYATYRLVLGDLPLLRGLRDLFLYLQWPHPIRGTEMDTFAATLEKETMGASYDSKAGGKWSRPPRIWYDGPSRDGTVRSPDGTCVWPLFDDDAQSCCPPPPFEYT